MKKLYLLVLILISTNVAMGQLCPFTTVATLTACGGDNYNFHYCWQSSGSQQKRVKISSANNCLTECINATHSGCKDYTFYSSTYPIIQIESFTGNSCNGTVCHTTVLSVEFNYFDVVRNRSNAVLRWQTASEQNSKEFLVERSSNSIDWVVVKNIPSKALWGNSPVALDYECSDFNPAKGLTYYRIRQIDLSMNEVLSEIRSVKGWDQKAGTVISPVPNRGIFTITFDGSNDLNNKKVVIYSSEGNLIWSDNVAINSLFVNLNQKQKVHSGSYYLKVNDDPVIPFVIQK